MKKQFKKIVAFFCLLFLTINVYSQSCVLDRVPSSGNFSKDGGTNSFAIIRQVPNCSPSISMTSNGWFSYKIVPYNSQQLLLNVTALPNNGLPRTGYIYIDNKESLKITINQAPGAGVVVPTSGVSVTPTSGYISVNETLSLNATVSPMYATNKNLIWTTSNPNVATITYSSNYGAAVKGMGSGKAQIIATTENGGYQAVCNVTVTSEPKSFSWKSYKDTDGIVKDFTTPAKDQKSGDPCFIFAAIGMIEAKYKIQNKTTYNIDLAEGNFTTSCLNYPPFISKVLSYVKTNGVLEESCFPYNRSNYGYGSPPFPDCDKGICINTTPKKYKINGFTEINLSNVNPDLRSDYLKSIIRQYGTVAFSMPASYIHNYSIEGAHAYELYGWNGNNWLLKDSWPDAPNSNLVTDLDLPKIMAENYVKDIMAAYYIDNVTTLNKLSGEISNQNSFVENKTTKTFEIVPNPATTQIEILNFPEEGGLVQIYNSSGKMIFNSKLKNNIIDVSNLLKGYYVVKVNTKGEEKMLKFIKQ